MTEAQSDSNLDISQKLILAEEGIDQIIQSFHANNFKVAQDGEGKPYAVVTAPDRFVTWVETVKDKITREEMEWREEDLKTLDDVGKTARLDEWVHEQHDASIERDPTYTSMRRFMERLEQDTNIDRVSSNIHIRTTSQIAQRLISAFFIAHFRTLTPFPSDSKRRQQDSIDKIGPLLGSKIYSGETEPRFAVIDQNGQYIFSTHPNFSTPK